MYIYTGICGLGENWRPKKHLVWQRRDEKEDKNENENKGKDKDQEECIFEPDIYRFGGDEAMGRRWGAYEIMIYNIHFFGVLHRVFTPLVKRQQSVIVHRSWLADDWRAHVHESHEEGFGINQ